MSEIDTKKVEEALEDRDWVISMQEELNQFERPEGVEAGTHAKEQVYNWHQMSIQK